MIVIEAKWHNGENDQEVIDWMENQLGYCFPSNYKEIISLYDGATPKKNSFDFINIYGKKDERDLNFLSFQPVDTKYSPKGYYIPMEDFQVSECDYGIKGLVAFGDCANGDRICFDYRDNTKTCNPKVVLVYHDDFIEQNNGTAQMVVNFVADSFEEFIDMLHE